MGFPPQEWFEDVALPAPVEGLDLARRVRHLFDAVVHPGTGKPYTNAEVARMSAGEITEQEVEAIRTGAIAGSLTIFIPSSTQHEPSRSEDYGAREQSFAFCVGCESLLAHLP